MDKHKINFGTSTPAVPVLPNVLKCMFFILIYALVHHNTQPFKYIFAPRTVQKQFCRKGFLECLLLTMGVVYGY